ncbi:MAG: FtsW/RodA/SpoVE family cell cycle protein [Pseudomonadota bacterium]
MIARILLALLCALQLLALWRSPDVYSPSIVAVTLSAGQSLTLGSAELAAPQAAPAHIGLRRDAAGTWWVRNVSAGRPLILKRDGVDTRMGASTLRAGQRFRIGSALFEVGTVQPRVVTFSGAGQQWRYDGATLLRNGSAQAPCPDTRITARVAALWNRAAPHALTLARPLTFGGNLQCGNRIGIAHLPGGSALLARGDHALLLSNAAGSEASAPVLLASRDLAQKEEALQGVSALTAGRTRMAVSIDGSRLALRPVRNVALFTEQQAWLPAAITWTWQERSSWNLPTKQAWWTMLALCAVLAAWTGLTWQRGMARSAATGTALLVIAGVGALISQRSGASLGVGMSMLLGWAALWTWLLLEGRLTLATGAGILLLAAGLLAQLELGLGAMETSWLRHFHKTTALLAIGLGAAAHVRLRMRSARGVVPQTRLEWALALLAGAAVAALLMQVLFGDETGVFDLQPVEFAKLALTALTAHCIAVGLGWHKGPPQPMRWFRLAGPALLFAGLLGLALLQVDDYSPLILLLVWSLSMALAWSFAARRHAVTIALAALGCVAVGTIAWMRAGSGDMGGFYADRFAVWLDPARHPHTGQQLLLAARAIAEGAWWGADNWLGLGALGQAAGSALHIPAVQDDFAPSFFMNRHGLLGALALWALQVLFLAGVLQTAVRAFAAGEQARDFRQAWLGRFRCFALCGGAAFVLGHLLLSWGTNLAIFPIMGQPMSFLSAGGSHLLFFICPLLAFSAISAQSIEENLSCRSTSNMKSWAR